MNWNIKSNDHINNCFVSLDFIFSPWMPLYQLLHHGCRSFTFVQDDALPFVITQNGGRKRIFILFFCVIPPSQYPPSGFAGHLLINKEAYPIPILPVRIPFLNTVANPLLTLWMTPYRPIVILNRDKNALWERRKTKRWRKVKNLLLWWHLNGLYKDHEVGRQKELWRTQCDWGYSLVVMI